jgi:endonuclease/exonuclease/phosphatase family metal-dependent hydrolase
MMQVQKLLKPLVFLGGICCTVLYLYTCLTPYISPITFHYLSFGALFFPIVFFGMLAWTIISLFFYRKYFLFFLLCLAMGYQNIIAVFAFHSNKIFVPTKQNEAIRILSWNVNSFLSGARMDSVHTVEMLQFIKASGADIFCFQDYSSVSYPVNASTDFISKDNQMPHHFFAEADANYGVIIFSKWPIIRKGSIPYNNIGSLEKLQFVDIQTPSGLLRVFNTHFASMNIHVDLMDKTNANKLKFINYDTAILLRKDKLWRLAYFDRLHVQQAALVKQTMDSSAEPFIFTADLNAVPSSFVYHQLRKGLKDVFIEKGFGMGRTYDSLSPTLRIDVILTSPNIKTVQYQAPRLHLSDHLPIITDIHLKP